MVVVRIQKSGFQTIDKEELIAIKPPTRVDYEKNLN